MSDELYIYAETAFHHEGDLDYMLQLIDAAASCGVHGIKFQLLLDFDYLVSKKHAAREVLLKYTFDSEQWKKIILYANSKKLDVILMPLDPNCFQFIKDLGVTIKYLEIHSVCFHDDAVLGGMKKTNIPIIIGVGGRTVDEIQEKQHYFKDQLHVLMAGFQAFPSQLKDVKLKKIKDLSLRFPALTIGYADHSSYDNEHAVISNEYALLLGARMFEKHLTINEGLKRVDFEAAVGPEKLRSISERLYALNEIISINDTDLHEIVEPELTYRNRQKVAVAKSVIEKGTILSDQNIIFRMTSEQNGIGTKNDVLGKTINTSLEPFQLVKKEMLV